MYAICGVDYLSITGFLGHGMGQEEIVTHKDTPYSSNKKTLN